VVGVVAKRAAVGQLGVEMEAERVNVMAAAGMAAVTEGGEGCGLCCEGTGWRVEATKVAAVEAVVL
jgi:hypothetical protein